MKKIFVYNQGKFNLLLKSKKLEKAIQWFRSSSLLSQHENQSVSITKMPLWPRVMMDEAAQCDSDFETFKLLGAKAKLTPMDIANRKGEIDG